MYPVLPAEKPASSIKKWIAHSEGFAKGEIRINACAEDIDVHQAASLLPIGVTPDGRRFRKRFDMVRIFDHEGNQVGVGRIGYNSEKARSLIGKQGARPLYSL